MISILYDKANVNIALRRKRNQTNVIFHVLPLKKIVHKPGQFPIRHSIKGTIISLSMGQKKDLPQMS